MKYINSANIHIKSWCNNPEQSAIDQATNLANHPCMFHHVALMPDTHSGYGMPIGGVIAVKNAIIPNAVGVDIGCGMLAIKTSISREEMSIDKLKSIMSKIRATIPLGKSRHKEATELSYLMPNLADFNLEDKKYICSQEYNTALLSLGTLGGGNHFIEIQYDENDKIWFMLHSGSRNLGKKIADHYNKVAIELNSKWHSSIHLEHQLNFLPSDSQEGQDYIAEMNFALEFAKSNRIAMSKRIMEAFKTYLPLVEFEKMINIHHNYAALEHHFGQNVWIHRKGATRARLEEIGIIPGSQGTNSYIVEGLGNADSFQSCSHGAGRTMSRTQARNTLNFEEEVAKMNEKGILHSVRNKDSLDEAPSSYKDIDLVMEEQKDLVKILYKLSPLGAIKG